jgi:very-short-patch-repair endonuclease
LTPPPLRGTSPCKGEEGVFVALVFNPLETLVFRKKLRKNMTEAEVILWSRLKGEQMGVKFRRQYGVRSYILDFYCPTCKLAIEVDGGIHNEKEQAEYDAMRQASIEALGIRFLRFTNNQVKYDLANVLKRIGDEVKEIAL